MRKITEQLNTLARSIRLTDEEKAAMRRMVHAYMAQYPVVRILRTHWWTSRAFVMAFSVVLMVTAVSYIAEQSAPGQFLYVVKTGVNEKIRDHLPMSPEHAMGWEVTKQERRSAEVELIATELGL